MGHCMTIVYVVLLIYFCVMLGFNAAVFDSDWEPYRVRFNNATINPPSSDGHDHFDFDSAATTYDNLAIACMVANSCLIVDIILYWLASKKKISWEPLWIVLLCLFILLWIGSQAGQVIVGASIWKAIDDILDGHPAAPVTLQVSVGLGAPAALVVALLILCVLCWCFLQFGKNSGSSGSGSPLLGGGGGATSPSPAAQPQKITCGRCGGSGSVWDPNYYGPGNGSNTTCGTCGGKGTH